MVYTLNKGLESEQWRKYIAGFAALFISAAMPVLSTLVFNTADNAGNGVKGVSSVNKPAEDNKQSSDKPKDTNTPSSNSTNQTQPAATSTPQTGTTTNSTPAATVSPTPYLPPTAGGSTQPSSSAAAPSYTTSGGGRGSGGTAASASDTTQSTDCNCSSTSGTTSPITVEVENVLGTQVNPASPADSSLEIKL